MKKLLLICLIWVTATLLLYSTVTYTRSFSDLEIVCEPCYHLRWRVETVETRVIPEKYQNPLIIVHVITLMALALTQLMEMQEEASAR